MLKPMNPTSWIKRIAGRWRLLLNACPRCNSDAPHVDKCVVCRNVMEGAMTQPNRRQQYPPTMATKAMWWYCWLHPGMQKMQREIEKESTP